MLWPSCSFQRRCHSWFLVRNHYYVSLRSYRLDFFLGGGEEPHPRLPPVKIAPARPFCVHTKTTNKKGTLLGALFYLVELASTVF